MKKILLTTLIIAAAMWAPGLARNCYAQNTDARPIKVNGSTTVADLIQPWISEFEKDVPRVKVVLYGTTMGKGLEALLNKTADVCMGARFLSKEEQAKASEKAFKLTEELLCYDAVAIVVNPQNSVSEITLDQLAKIFGGQYTNWNQLGGPSEPITVVTMPPDSGMRTFLCGILKTDMHPNAITESSKRTVLGIVENRKGAITFCRTNQALEKVANKKLKALAIKGDESSPAVPLSQKAITDGSYPIIRPLSLIYDAAAGDHLKQFVEFVARRAKTATRE
jgi:phosphate transport system substrate-binding protein